MTPSPSPLWFVDRSAGEVTLLLLSAVMILGVIRSAVPTWNPLLVEGAHINLALLTVAFATLHIVGAVLDPFAHLGLTDVLVPFASAYRGTWLGLGAISGYAYALTLVISWPARRLPRAAWIWLHRSMYVAWVLALLHSLGTGSDTRNELFLLLNVAAVAGVLVVFLALRAAEGWRANPPLWAALALVAVLLIVGIAVWAVDGPLQPGWARAAGTPPDLLRGH